MTEYNKSEFNIKEFKDFLISITKIVFDQIPIPINFIDKDSKIIVMNQAFLDYLGLELKDVVGKHITEIDPTVRLPLVLATGKPEIGKKHKFKDGREAIVHRIPLFFKDQLIGGVGVILFDDLNYLYNLAIESKLLKNVVFPKYSNVANVYKAKYTFDDIITNSSNLIKCKKKALSYSKTDFSVLITGESGVGKELFAHAIHNASKRKKQPFVSVNCAAIPESLIESELFGYEKGAFTGALKSGKKGKFEIANSGTIFLDEIGDLPLNMQAKLLRVLQENEIEKIGSDKIIEINVRVISATNHNLEQKVENGSFRKDLYYRLNLLNLKIPPLRKRKEDVPLLVKHFSTILYQKHNILKEFPKEILDIFVQYPWYGNIREFRNVLINVAVNSNSKVITYEDIPKYILDELNNNGVNNNNETDVTDNNDSIENNKYVLSENQSLKSLVDKFEKDIIEDTLIKCKYNKTKTAEVLGIPRMTLYRKLKTLQI